MLSDNDWNLKSPGGQGSESQPGISVSSCSLRASPCGSSTWGSSGFPTVLRLVADELRGPRWKLHHLPWVSLGSHMASLSPSDWSRQSVKSSFKRKSHRPTHNGSNVKEFVSIFKITTAWD